MLYAMAGVAMTDSPRSLLELQERSFLQFQERLLELFLRVHHDWAVPGDRFLEWFSRNQQEPDAVFARLHFHLIAGVEEHQRAIFRLLWGRCIGPADSFGRHRQRARRVAEFAAPRKNIGEGVAA